MPGWAKTYKDITVTFSDRGACDGVPGSATHASFKTLCRSITLQSQNEEMRTDAMGSDYLYRMPGKLGWSIEGEALIGASGTIAITEGNYSEIVLNTGYGTDVTYLGVCMGVTTRINDNQETVFAFTIVGPAPTTA